jgi:hypothetical protein
MGYPPFGLFLDINLGQLLLFVHTPDIDATCRFMLTAGGNRGWGGSSTEVVLGYDINVVN